MVVTYVKEPVASEPERLVDLKVQTDGFHIAMIILFLEFLRKKCTGNSHLHNDL